MPWQNARPGDLGRRITYHREKLGLTREQVAERAGMAPGFLEYLEQRPSSLTQGVLLRLAAALETTADELLGGTTDRPPGGGPAAAYPELRALEPRECLRLDHIDEARREGWSVLIQGPACPVAPDEPPVPGLEPWPGGDRGLHIRIVPRHITGRRIHGL